MKFMEKIKSFFGGSSRRNKHVYVVDGARMLDERNGRRMGPRDQLQILSMLDRVSQQEGIAIRAVLESDRPLREVDDGGEFGSVRVYFAPDSDALVKQMLKLASKGKDYVLVGNGSRLEKEAIAKGITLMSASTFRRAFCQSNNGGGGGGNNREGGGNRNRGNREGGNRNRRNRRGRGGNGNSNGNKSGGNNPAAQNPPKENTVKQLIDLVE